jgi:peptide/nickel transport system ATP-binding protein
MTNQAPLLKITDLRTYFDTEYGPVKAVDGVSFCVKKGEAVALVGESGCGKSITALSIMQLINRPPGRIVSGRIEFEGQDLLAFNEPMTSLNPVLTCGNQIVEAIMLHRAISSREAEELAIAMLAKVGIPEPAQRFREYPHQLSGGMQQRVMIAIALSCNPMLLIADEPTTALDVTIQAQILDLLKLLQVQGLSILLITHDLGVVAEAADMVGVMYASRIAEFADVKSLFSSSLHPYTKGLFKSLPRLGEKKHRLDTIIGNVPHPLHHPAGCVFHPRCAYSHDLALQGEGREIVDIGDMGNSRRVLARCAEQCPQLLEVQPGHWCACWEAEGYSQGKPTNPSER